MLRPCILLTCLSLAACGDDDKKPNDTAETIADTTADSTADTTADSTADTTPDTAADTADTADSAPDTAADTTPDTAADTTPDTAADTETDGTPSDAIVAKAGERCELAERVGLIILEDNAQSPPVFYLSGAIEDRVDPWIAAPELASEACDFHRFESGACPVCDDGELCGGDGVCVPAPRRLTDARITLTAGGDAQVFDANAETGDLFGQVTLAGDTFALDVAYGDRHITLASIQTPGLLTDLAGTLEGGYEAPTALDVTWKTNATGTHVFTRIPINHHAAGPTFTECTVPATSGSLSVEEAMLMPLAVITGLEFQGLEHIRFAAADTPAGCVEIRFTLRHYVNF